MILSFEPSASCPACNNCGLDIFYQAKNVPVHSVLLMQTREEALSYPKGDIELGFCNTCGFITNVAFDPTLHEYSSRYEATQGYSETFNAFHRRLAARLIAKHDLHHKDIIEIGCDKGDFLTMLCEMGNNRGVGVDPAYVPGRVPSTADVRFIKDVYSERYEYLKGDFIVCKMTLEHIRPVFEFVSMVRRSIGQKKNAVVFFQIPNAEYVFRDIAFWDIYYEHCSYFTKQSLTHLFSTSGFTVLDVATEYNEQYLTIEARPGNGIPRSAANDVEATRLLIRRFGQEYPKRMAAWRELVERIRRDRTRAVIWGAGSKGVAFLTALNVTTDVMPYAVDINPNKRGTFMAGTGQEIVTPDFLTDYRPDLVIAMNPIYKEEIQHDLTRRGIGAKLVTL